MRILSVTRINDFCETNPKAAKEMKTWIGIVKSSGWKSPADVKAAFGSRVDFVAVGSGATTFVFDITNNKWRMITAIHFVAKKPIAGRVFVLRILTHAEYDTNKWKQEL